MRNQLKDCLILGAFFALYLFAFLLTEVTVNLRSEALLGAASVNTVYAVGITCTGLGYLFFSVSCKLIASDKSRKFMLMLFGLLFFASSSALMLITHKVPFFVAAYSALFSFGYIGGNVHYYFSVALEGSLFIGRVIGISGAFAVLLQFFVQNFLITGIAFPISVLLAVSGVLLISVNPPKSNFHENSPSYSDKADKLPKSGVVGIAAVLLMSIIVSLNDGLLTAFHASGTVNIISYSRLFYVVGLATAGFLADLRKRRFFALAAVCVMFVSAIAPLFLSSPHAYTVNASLVYLYCGFYVVFLTVWFIDLAPKTANPKLWAGMGRLVRCLTTAIIVVPSVSLFDCFGMTAISIVGCILSVITLLLFALTGLLLPAKPVALKTSAEEASTEESRRHAFVAKYGLTSREADVLGELLNGSDSTQVISETLYVSRRMVERYFTQIYEKTNTKTRIALLLLYYGDGKQQ